MITLQQIRTGMSPDTTLVLGVFNKPTFIFYKELGVKYFGELSGNINRSVPWVDVLFTKYPNLDKWLTKEVAMMMDWAIDIIFILDDVYFPIDIQNSVTCLELYIICSQPHIFEKTTFIKRDLIIDFDKNLVV